MVQAGRITLRGSLATDASQLVNAWEVQLDGAELDPGTGLVVLLHKPKGYICAHKGDGRLLYELLPDRWTRRRPVVSSVGRLDADTSGVLLLTDNGALLHRLTSPKHKVPKVYEVKLEAPLRGDAIEVLGSGGLMLEGEDKPLLPAELEIIQPTLVRLTLYEGRFHQVKRMFEALENRVIDLHRSSFGGLTLGDLAPGQYKFLSGAEVSALILK